jgi:hypothetical protein
MDASRSAGPVRVTSGHHCAWHVARVEREDRPHLPSGNHSVLQLDPVREGCPADFSERDRMPLLRSRRLSGPWLRRRRPSPRRRLEWCSFHQPLVLLLCWIRCRAGRRPGTHPPALLPSTLREGNLERQESSDRQLGAARTKRDDRHRHLGVSDEPTDFAAGPSVVLEQCQRLASQETDMRFWFSPVAEAFNVERRPGRKGRGDDFYAGWADRYERVGGRTPIADLATESGTPIETVRHFINEARRRRLLTQTKPGKPGGRLTAKGREALHGVD